MGRLKYMPLVESELIDELQKGVIYWHGRDHKCRPCLVIRTSRISKEWYEDPARFCKVAMFMIEYMLRYGMCPGRVENWGMIVDCANSTIHGNPAKLIAGIVETIQGLYRFRMAWTKVVNAPWYFATFWKGIKALLPGDTVKKVEILGADCVTSLSAVMAPEQLEKKYGGKARDLTAPVDFFPIRMP